MLEFANSIFPIRRSLTGKGVTETLRKVADVTGTMEIPSVPSGTKVFDWTIPDEWSITAAQLIDPNGDVVVDYVRDGNLSVLQYSEPVNVEIDLKDLQNHLFSVPNAIPYVTSYYKRNWGFCLTDERRKAMVPGTYKAIIISKLFNGYMSYGHVYYYGETEKTILFSTNICHPSLAINEVSGIVVAAYLARHISMMPRRRYNYRFLFVPETIGTLAFIDRHGLDRLRKELLIGFCLSCMSAAPNYMAATEEMCNSDVLSVLPRLHRISPGSCDRQYISPNINLPVMGLYGTMPMGYTGYHTSRDNMDLLSEDGLQSALDWFKDLVFVLENDYTYKLNTIGEPFLSKYEGMYHDISTPNTSVGVRKMLDIVSACNGQNSAAKIAKMTEADIHETVSILSSLYEKGIVSRV
jgi:aminopeptidase-like protein